MKAVISLLLFILTLGAGSLPAFAQKNACVNAVTLYGRLKPEFLAKHNENYTREIPDQTPVKNQCSLGTCHIYSITSQLEMSFQRTHGKQLILSADYLTYNHIVSRLESLMESHFIVGKFALGGDLGIDWSLVENVGLMPEGVYKFNPVYNSKDFAPRMEQFILNLKNRAVLEISELEKKDKSKSEAGRNALSRKREAVIAKTKAQLFDFIDQYIGTPPKTFVFEGETLTPRKFSEKYFPALQGPFYDFEIRAFKRVSPLELKQRGSAQYAKINVAESLDEIKKAIDDGKNVYLGYFHKKAFTDAKTGIQSISAFEIPPGGEPLPRAYREENNIDREDGHAVQIVGYEMSPEGKMLRLKIKNSWGQKAGDAGYFHMSIDYYAAFSYRLGIF